MGEVGNGDSLTFIPRFNIMGQDPPSNEHGVPWLQTNAQAQVRNAKVSASEVTESCDDSVCPLGVM